jgi:hypothetical protein
MSTTLICTGIACIAAAIVGGGLKAFGMEIPALNSIARQLLLAAFGAVLILVPLAPRITQPPVKPASPDATSTTHATPVSSDVDFYSAKFQADRTDADRLVKDGELAFEKRRYDWAVKFFTQARQVGQNGTWELGYPYLYAAQLSEKRISDAAITKTQMLDAVRVAVETRQGFFSRRSQIEPLIQNVAKALGNSPDRDFLIGELKRYEQKAQP